MAALLQDLFQRVEDLRAPADRFRNRWRAQGRDHEFLEVDGVVGMRAAIDDVHHGHGQDAGIHAADIAIDRQIRRLACRLRNRQRNAEDRIRAKTAFVLRAVEHDQRVIDVTLVLGVHALKRIEDFAVHGVDRLQHALAEIARAAVALFDGLMGAGRSARRYCGAAHRPVFKHDVDFDGWIAAAIEDFAACNVRDGCHEETPSEAQG